jgi:hypothetical protein
MYVKQTLIYVVCIMIMYVLWLRDYIKNKDK